MLTAIFTGYARDAAVAGSAEAKAIVATAFRGAERTPVTD